MIQQQIDVIKQRKALTWLSNEIRGIPNLKFKKEKVLTEGQDGNIEESITLKKIHDSPPLCDLVLFEYDASVGNVLTGMYDKYPIVLVVRPFPDHFFGFNMHYIDKNEREKIVNVLKDLNLKSGKNKKLAFKLIYPFLDALVKIKVNNHAYKNYSYENIESKFVTINPMQYDLVVDLPIATMKRNKK